MSYEFKKLGEVEALETVPESANALIEVDGAIKRVPGSGLGGSAVLIFSSADGYAWSANMTYDEAKALHDQGILTCFVESQLGASDYNSFRAPATVVSTDLGSDGMNMYIVADFICSMSNSGTPTIHQLKLKQSDGSITFA